MVVLGEGEVEKTKRFSRDAREIEKFLKIVWDLTQFVQNMRFSRLNWLAKMSHQNPFYKILKIYSKSFSWLGLLLTSELRTFLSNLATGLPLVK